MKKLCSYKHVLTTLIFVLGASLSVPGNLQAQAITKLEPEQPQYSPQAVASMKSQALAGDARAEIELGLMYQKGLGVQQDYGQARAWYQKAADQGNATAEDNLGILYLNGWGISKNYGRALAYFQKAAAQGNASAEYDLGWMYQNGAGVPPDDVQAIAWYQKAAAQGEVEAETSLGWMYQRANGFPQDYAQAITWFQKGAAQGDAGAENGLGWMYQNGFGVQQDNARAIAWYQKAIAQGNRTANTNLTALHQEISKAHQSPASNGTTVTPVAQADNEQASAGDVCNLPKDSGEGLVIFSGTLPPDFAYFNYLYQRNGGLPILAGGEVHLRLDRGHISSDFTSVSGKLFIRRLRAGTYRFGSWQYAYLVSAGVDELSKGIHPLTFAVEGGRAVYLGGFDPIVFDKKGAWPQKTTIIPWVLVRDDHSRDVPVFSNKCPGFDPNQFDIRVMDPSPWFPPPTWRERGFLVSLAQGQ